MPIELLKPKVVTVGGGRRAQYFRMKSGAYRVCAAGDQPTQIGFIWSKAPRTKHREEPLHYGFRHQPVGDETIDDADYTGDFPRFADAVLALLLVAEVSP